MSPIANMLNMIENAGKAGKPTVTVPFSSVKSNIAKVLFDTGYIAGYTKKTRKPADVLEIAIAYTGAPVMGKAQPRVHEINMVSKPSRRMYAGVRDIKPVKQGRGLLVLSTPKGILSGDKAIAEQVGGEVIAEIW
jgi:small subunit ribosomal protein S8